MPPVFEPSRVVKRQDLICYSLLDYSSTEERIMMSESANGKRFSPKFKFQVVLEVIESDQSVPDVARSYDVHSNTVYNWKGNLTRKVEPGGDVDCGREIGDNSRLFFRRRCPHGEAIFSEGQVPSRTGSAGIGTKYFRGGSGV
jgi:hypothetical protein